MYVEDAIVSKLLSLRFYEFADADRHGLDKNVTNSHVQSVVSEAARCYLYNALELGAANADHLEAILEWLVSKGRAIDPDVVADFTRVMDGLRDGTIYQGGASHSRSVAQPRF